MNPTEIQKFVQHVSELDGFKAIDRTMLERYFLREFCIWLPLRQVALLTGIENPSTVSLQIKKLNKEERFKYEIVKIRRMLKELILIK